VLAQIVYTGVDASPFLIARAQAQFGGPQRAFVVGNAYSLPFADQSFDAAFSIALWHLLGDLPKAMAEMHRVLKQKGHFLAITAHPEAYALWQGRYAESRVVGERLEGRVSAEGELDILYLYPLEKLHQVIEDAGFEILSLQGFRPVQDHNMFLMIKGQKR
jgi:ubiquinone/menaquinone biosynthesis C-methylase UbiE